MISVSYRAAAGKKARTARKGIVVTEETGRKRCPGKRDTNQITGSGTF
jgi:hypothetical protein